MTFNSRHYRIAENIANMAAELWLADKLSLRNVRSGIRAMYDVSLDSGAFRTSVLLKDAVIKVPHHRDAIRSTMLEYRLFDAVRKNRTIAMHFPKSELVIGSTMPVLLQERVPMVATQEIEENHPMAQVNYRSAKNPVHVAVEKFAKKLGLGDTHSGNYGWKENRKGFYPVFFDCEVSPGMTDYKPHQIEKVVSKKISWDYEV